MEEVGVPTAVRSPWPSPLTTNCCTTTKVGVVVVNAHHALMVSTFVSIFASLLSPTTAVHSNNNCSTTACPSEHFNYY